MAGPPTVEAVVGTVIHGTLLPEDLLLAFMEALETLDGERANGIRKEYAEVFKTISGDRSIADGDYQLTMDAAECLGTLYDALNACAPEGLFFGSHPGDGGDFGFWPVEGN